MRGAEQPMTTTKGSAEAGQEHVMEDNYCQLFIIYHAMVKWVLSLFICIVTRISLLAACRCCIFSISKCKSVLAAFNNSTGRNKTQRKQRQVCHLQQLGTDRFCYTHHLPCKILRWLHCSYRDRGLNSMTSLADNFIPILGTWMKPIQRQMV